uniref:DUF3119 domain-containing protein n=1 Tax=Paulinella chromatophora TaxID=39717 RepID=B1X3J4_PAUCH|nr:hypothetical protein PCC_0054 [Paulinella chromatophora]ACB42513.1 hypothetical protein PCC_0054 [Paulinella chromatophora]
MNKKDSNDVMNLSSHFGIAIGILGIGIIMLALNNFWNWIELPGYLVLAFGLFLIVQSSLLTVKLNSNSFAVYRKHNLLRQFPYEHWIHWRLFWPSLPILFYFRERKSIHFLPTIFDVKILRSKLDQTLIYKNSQSQLVKRPDSQQ